jgi:hypothetical protein
MKNVSFYPILIPIKTHNIARSGGSGVCRDLVAKSSNPAMTNAAEASYCTVSGTYSPASAPWLSQDFSTSKFSVMSRFSTFFAVVLMLVVWAVPLSAQNTVPRSALKASGAPNNPKVEVAWNRFYDTEAVHEILQRLNRAYPGLSDLQSLGKSHEGRDLWMMTITNKETGNHRDKPGMYIAGSIHANEVQATEVTLYTAWYLLESYATNRWIRELVDSKTFYIIPVQSPDSRDAYLHQPNTSNTPRTGQVPRDIDGDGEINDDGFNDLDGDGHIVQMRIRVPGGRWTTHPDDPRLMVQARADQRGEYEVFWTEGFDMDGDGRINEDGDGGYDPNRNWGWLWRPNYVQRGSDYFPFSLPETRAVSDFVKAHPNILGGQSYHNTGGMILRGPGAREDATYNGDIRVYDVLGEMGAEMLPGYDYLVVWRDLYTVYGGETDWLYASMGIMPFVNELYTSYNMFHVESSGFFGRREEMYRFDELLLFGDAVVDWKTVEHPDFGEVEIGGLKKNTVRVPPSFQLEEEAHRNMAFTLWHAYHLPILTVEDVQIESIGRNRYEIRASVMNHRAIPTRMEVDVVNGISRPDWISIEGGTVVTGGVRERYIDRTFAIQEHRADRLDVPVVPGMSAVHVTWIVEGRGPFTIKVDSQRGGKASKTVRP